MGLIPGLGTKILQTEFKKEDEKKNPRLKGPTSIGFSFVADVLDL